ncbi:hypothetical protein IG631_17792 [Alternaria alternata]|nr:hypothetical protein IG631_17792 [Alternaria alternata]
MKGQFVDVGQTCGYAFAPTCSKAGGAAPPTSAHGKDDDLQGQSSAGG